MIVVGYILVAVSINVMGDIEGKSVNYYTTEADCILDAMLEENKAPKGLGFTCVEDYLR